MRSSIFNVAVTTVTEEIPLLLPASFLRLNQLAYSFRYSEYSEHVLDQWNISEQCAVFFRTCSGCSKYVNRGVAHLLAELPRDSRWRKEESYFSVKEQCSEYTPFRTEQNSSTVLKCSFQAFQNIVPEQVYWKTPNTCLGHRSTGDRRGEKFLQLSGL